MSNPSIIKVSPNPGAVEVVLGTSIVVGFDQPINTATFNSQTFSLTGPGVTKIISPEQLNARYPRPATGRSVVTGTFSFTTDTDGNTVATFTPSKPLEPNVTYTVLVVGAEVATTTTTGQMVANSAGDPLDSSNQWTFTTGDLNISVPPVVSPLQPTTYPLDPSKVRIQQHLWAVGNDLSQQIDVIFPAPINPDTISVQQILLSLEPILNDPEVRVPTGLTPTVTISGNTITIIISGWPTDQYPDWPPR